MSIEIPFTYRSLITMSKSFEINQQSYTKDHGEIVLYQRPDHKNPKWQTRIKVKGSTGYVRKSTGSTDEFEARQFAESLYDSLVDKFKATGSTQTKTFKDVVDEWLKVLKGQEKKPEVIKEFKDRLYNYPVRYWGNTYIDRLQPQDLIDFIDWRKSNGRHKKRPSDTTILKDLVPLKQVLRYAYGKKYMPSLLHFDDSLSAKSERRPDFTAKEWKAILQHLDNWVELAERHPSPHRNRLYLKYFILIIGNTGIRPGTESKSITWNCIDFHQFAGRQSEQLVIRVPQSKARTRWVVPNQVVESYLNSLKKFRQEELEKLKKTLDEDEPIFCHKDGKPIASFKKGFRAFLQHYHLLKDMDGNERVPYSLRHTFATRHIDMGTNHWNLAKNMGTSVEELERHYVHDDHKKYGSEFLDAQIPQRVNTIDEFFMDEE